MWYRPLAIAVACSACGTVNNQPADAAADDVHHLRPYRPRVSDSGVPANAITSARLLSSTRSGPIRPLGVIKTVRFEPHAAHDSAVMASASTVARPTSTFHRLWRRGRRTRCARRPPCGD